MDEPEIKIIDVFICKLRKKLANASSRKDYIETVWGRGYVLRELSEGQARISGNRFRRASAMALHGCKFSQRARLLQDAVVMTRDLL
jgi:DNA-binding winged helix-turn-helix (wHTH) protein